MASVGDIVHVTVTDGECCVGGDIPATIRTVHNDSVALDVPGLLRKAWVPLAEVEAAPPVPKVARPKKKPVGGAKHETTGKAESDGEGGSA